MSSAHTGHTPAEKEQGPGRTSYFRRDEPIANSGRSKNMTIASNVELLPTKWILNCNKMLRSKLKHKHLNYYSAFSSTNKEIDVWPRNDLRDVFPVWRKKTSWSIEIKPGPIRQRRNEPRRYPRYLWTTTPFLPLSLPWLWEDSTLAISRRVRFALKSVCPQSERITNVLTVTSPRWNGNYCT